MFATTMNTLNTARVDLAQNDLLQAVPVEGFDPSRIAHDSVMGRTLVTEFVGTNLYTVDPLTGLSTHFSDTTMSGMDGLDVDQATGDIYVSRNDRLLVLDPLTGAIALDLALTWQLVALTVRTTVR